MTHLHCGISNDSLSAGDELAPFSFAWEKLDDLLADGIEDILILDWEEVENDAYLGVPYDPDWDRFRRFEKMGSFKTLVARYGREIVGYNAFVIVPRLHSKARLEAYNSLIYALPGCRGRVGAQLVRKAEQDLKTMGVRRIRYDAKTSSGCEYDPAGGRFGALLRALGYAHVESGYAKHL